LPKRIESADQIEPATGSGNGVEVLAREVGENVDHNLIWSSSQHRDGLGESGRFRGKDVISNPKPCYLKLTEFEANGAGTRELPNYLSPEGVSYSRFCGVESLVSDSANSMVRGMRSDLDLNGII
jgi:hypothetical protein